MRRGEVWWSDLPPPVGSRPVVILTRNSVIESIANLVVALVTRTHRGLPTEVPIGVREGLPRRSVVNVDNLLTIPRYRLVRQMGALSEERIHELNEALRYSLELGED